MLILALMSALAIAVSPPDFVNDVRPILERSCIGCHGPEKQKSGYRLDVRDIAIKGGDSGEAAIVPHDASTSPLIRYVSGEDEEMLMPPKMSGKPRLTSAQIDTLRAWINAGPRWPEEFAGASGDAKDHWSLRSLVKPSVPVGHAINPIDVFIRDKLALNKLEPAPAADRRTLIRRLYYDLIGLPPTPEEVDAIVADQTPTSYESLVTRLLASPRHGEHWARHWLDVAHYADTHGNDHDYARPNAWPYRDYVIRAFNADKPYARFIQEQVAGDALFSDDPQATVALGFLAAGPWDETLMVGVREDTVDHRFSQVLDRDDMVTTVMSTFSALTIHCARCHNHKFDPISQREYYALQAVFAGVDRADRPYDLDAATHVRRRELVARKTAIDRRDATVIRSLGTPEARREIDLFMNAYANRRKSWQPLEVVSVTSASGVATKFARQADGSWFVSGELPEKDTFIVTAQVNAKDIRAIRLEALPDDRLPGKGPGRYAASGNFHLTEFRVHAQPSRGETNGAVRLEFSRATADHWDRGDTIANAIDDQPKTFWSIHPRYGEVHEAVFDLKEPLGHDVGSTLIIRLEQTGTTGHQLGRFRLSYCTGVLPPDQRAPVPAALIELLRKPATERTLEQRRELSLQVLGYEVERQIDALPGPRMVYAVTRDFPSTGSFKPANTPRPIHLLIRGDLNQPGERVEPGSLACVQGLGAALAISNPSDESARRAALAQWLTDDRNSLTWRCIVNRVWHYHFGRGLCDTPNDFGKMGAIPSHPELLDWLAVWFRDEAKGSLKALHRLIVTSDTYRQSSQDQADHSKRDAENHLLWRMNRRRLTAEQVRDTLLQMSGRLDLTMGGPSVVQFVHRGKATFMPDGGAPPFLDYANFAPDASENGRRSVYRFLFRTMPDPFMDALDAPDGGSLTPVRGQSTTVFGAFALLNNAFVIRQCEHIAARLDKEAGDKAQVVRAFRLLLEREPRPEELARFTAYTRRHGLANACQIIVNSNEFLYID
jgi:Protein of unknown function (DUF1553)/Protein of unknown function (DUF1549)/Planctomycete cytochrome C